MSQQDVIKILEKQNKPLSGKEIAKLLESDISVVFHSIQRLVRSSEIKIIEIDRKEAYQRFRCKRRMRLYYL